MGDESQCRICGWSDAHCRKAPAPVIHAGSVAALPLPAITTALTRGLWLQSTGAINRRVILKGFHTQYSTSLHLTEPSECYFRTMCFILGTMYANCLCRPSHPCAWCTILKLLHPSSLEIPKQYIDCQVKGCNFWITTLHCGKTTVCERRLATAAVTT